MKEYYQHKGGKKGKYALRENTYRRIWYLIADYRYFKCVQAGVAEAEQLCADGGGEDGKKAAAVMTGAERTAEASGGYSSNEAVFDPGQILRYIKAIEDAQQKVPSAYVDYIMAHIIERMRYKDMEGVSERTMKIWVQRFIWNVAYNLGEA